MGKITISKARRILGNAAKNISDEQLEKEIEIAEILKDAFFAEYTSRNKQLVSNDNK